jgi:ketosteroid isomerase-like protein
MRSPRKGFGFVFALTLTLAACGGGEPEPEAAPPAEPMSEAGANAMRDGYVFAFMSKNPQGVAAYYAEDAVVHRDSAVISGRPAIQEALTAEFGTGVDSLGVTKESFEATGDQAIERGTFVTRQVDRETGERTYRRGTYVVTFGRQADGTFQIVKDSTAVTETVRPEP